MEKKRIKLGTRKSLLAWAQSSWVAKQVEKFHPHVDVELVGIETRGDRILDVSLQKVEGKDFFVAEIDQALQSRKVDFTVHSMKDLSLSRPSEVALAAVPKRENPRDVILFGPRALGRMKAGKVIQVGTSSPRRLENIPKFLSSALPAIDIQTGKRPDVNFVEIRGNVNTRLGRVHEPEASPKYLDAVVLAFAGIIRLWADPTGRVELQKLLSGVRWMILPLSECPAAPAQGALAIECRAEDQQLLRILQSLHDESSAKNVSRERALLAKVGGGCHQRFGATAVATPECGDLLWVKGVDPQGMSMNQLVWQAPKLPESGAPSGLKFWDGSHLRPKEYRSISESLSKKNENEPIDGGNLKSAFFVAHSRAATDPKLLVNSRIWTSGISSWFKLARQGVWVEGCAESLGFGWIVPTLQEGVLGLPPLAKWRVLTHSAAQRGWDSYGCQVFSTYEVKYKLADDEKSQISQAEFIFWSSITQYDELKEWISKSAKHACGPGKTAQGLRAAGIKPQVFPDVEEWRKWLRISKTSIT